MRAFKVGILDERYLRVRRPLRRASREMNFCAVARVRVRTCIEHFALNDGFPIFADKYGAVFLLAVQGHFERKGVKIGRCRWGERSDINFVIRSPREKVPEEHFR